MDDKAIYEQIGRIWMQFVTWREKILAGYVASLAALAVAFYQSSSPGLRCAVLAGVVVLSVVFWVLDIRSAIFANACQAVGDRLEGGKGAYAALTDSRFKSRVSYGLAMNVLVAAVIAAAAGGLWINLPQAIEKQLSMSPIVFAGFLGVLLLLLTQIADEWRRRRDKARLAQQPRSDDVGPRVAVDSHQRPPSTVS